MKADSALRLEKGERRKGITRGTALHFFRLALGARAHLLPLRPSRIHADEQPRMHTNDHEFPRSLPGLVTADTTHFSVPGRRRAHGRPQTCSDWRSFVLLSRKTFAGCANFSSELQEGRNMVAERYSLTLHFSASIFLPLSVAGPASPSSLGVLRSTSFGCGGAALGSFVVSVTCYAS